MAIENIKELLASAGKDELLALQAEIESRKKALARDAAKDLKNRYAALLLEAEELGVDLTGTTKPKEKAPAKYRNEAGKTWSGRGRQPVWLQEAIAAGHTKEDFLIAE